MSTEQPPRWSCWSWHRAAIGGTAATDPVSLDAGMRAACVGDEDGDGDGDGDGGEKLRGLRNTGRGENAEDLMMEKEERETRRRSSRERETAKITTNFML